MIHRDVNGKFLALLLLFVLSLGCMRLALAAPPPTGGRVVPGTVSASGEPAMRPAVHPEGPPVPGLDCMVPGGKGAAGDLDGLRDSGRLRGYSLPARMLAFTPDGGFVFIPPWPRLAGPRDPKVFFHGTRGRNRVALTFDTSDVSESEACMRVLDELTRLRVPATFFVCGAFCERNPEALEQMVARGFEVGNHSFDHPQFTAIPDEEVIAQLRRTEEAFQRVAGRSIAAYFRPPYGDYDARVLLLAAGRGYTTIMWDHDTLDWEADTTPEQLFSRATEGVAGGDIILMHTIGGHTAAGIERIAAELRSRGLELTTLSGVLEP